MSREAQEYMHFVAQLSCVACRKNGIETRPVEIHHSRKGVGMGQRASHFDTMPLCPSHHRLSRYDSVHLAYQTFVDQYGDESALVEQTRQDAALLRQSLVSNGVDGDG